MRRKKSFLRFALKPLMVILIVASFFAVLGHKNAFTRVEYSINMLEKKKMEIIKEGKYLMAEKARLSSIENIRKAASNPEEFHFPDRKKVTFVRTVKQPVPHTASYQSSAKSTTQ